ncbi:MAG: D-2-hydroxyacid dehydrogenase [Pseudohongiella sp.]|nr:D-2-hydroxyacid dehydrogenase [Pseudohongiella sp.]MDP2126124.1 D-2-hydroxyacid dehydrogenase [Pseudohongiella sp.]
MKAVMLDADSMGSGIDFSPIQQLVDTLVLYPQSQPADCIGRLHDADIAISNKVMLDAATLKALPSLKLVCVVATGMNNVDVAAAGHLGIQVRNVVAYGTASVAQHTMMLLLALANRLPRYQSEVAAGLWQRSDSFCLQGHTTLQLEGKHLVIVGSGELGTRLAHLAEAFGMRVSFTARPGHENEDSRPSLVELAPFADVISLHCPLNSHTRGIISRKLLATLKPRCILINCARGGLVDDQAALDALKAGELGGYGVDVLPQEPPRNGHILLDALHLPLNLIVTPHNAWITPEARQNLINKTADNIRNFLQK